MNEPRDNEYADIQTTMNQRWIWWDCRPDPRFKIQVLPVWKHVHYFSFTKAPHNAELLRLWRGKIFKPSYQSGRRAYYIVWCDSQTFNTTPGSSFRLTYWGISDNFSDDFMAAILNFVWYILWCRVEMSCSVCLSHPLIPKTCNNLVWWNNLVSISIIDRYTLTSVISWRPFWTLHYNDVK